MHEVAARGSYDEFSLAWNAWQKADESKQFDEENRSVLHAAVYGGNLKIVRKIAEEAHASKQIWCPDVDGRTPLHAVVAEARDDDLAVKMLGVLKSRSSDGLSLCRDLTAQQIFDLKDSSDKTVLQLQPSRSFQRAAKKYGFLRCSLCSLRL